MTKRVINLLILLILACGCHAEQPIDSTLEHDPSTISIEVPRPQEEADMLSDAEDRAQDMASNEDSGHDHMDMQQDRSGEDMSSEDPPDEPLIWTWQGIEVMGYTSLTREQILDAPPIDIGDRAPEPSDFIARNRHKAWGEQLATKHNLPNVHISSVRYDDGAAYLVVDIIEADETWRDQTRAAPTRPLVLSSESLRHTYNDFERLFWERFNTGDQEALRQEVVSDESGVYLDYPYDEELSERVATMRVESQEYRNELLEIIEFSSTTNERAMAASLLLWAGQIDESMRHIARLFDDPSILVRNNLARFTFAYLDHLRDNDAILSVIDAMMLMHTRPSHADRNQSIGVLLKLSEEHAFAREHIRHHQLLPFIQRTVDQSILFNTRDPARQLLGLLRD